MSELHVRSSTSAREANIVRARGFTIVELLVVLSIISILMAVLLPAIGKARDAAMLSSSLSNLRNMSAAHAAYSADWNDRQWGTSPDDIGLYGGSCATYVMTSCPPPVILGYTDEGVIGYYLGSSGACSFFGYPGNCGNWGAYWPNTFTPASILGSFRLPNVKSFNSYLGGRFYDPVFYAKKDGIILAGAEPYFAAADEFSSMNSTEIFMSSYCLSPAGMWSPDVLSRNRTTNQYWTNPTSLPGAWRSPSAGQAQYPDLKTRMLEHSWLQNQPEPVNTSFAGGSTPFFFNHAYRSAPATLFYDGHVSLSSVGDAMDSDLRSIANGGVPLWSRDTPLGTNGYYSQVAWDFLAETSYHILTVDGILGRDVLGAR